MENMKDELLKIEQDIKMIISIRQSLIEEMREIEAKIAARKMFNKILDINIKNKFFNKQDDLTVDKLISEGGFND